MRRAIFRLLWAIQIIAIVAALPTIARADPFFTPIAIAAYIIQASIAIGVSLVARAFSKPKPGAQPVAPMQVNTAREGESWPRPYGTIAMGAKYIERGNITSRSVTNGSGKRQGPPTTAYSCDVMLGICENLEDSVLGISRIWADDELLYSVDPASLDGTNPATMGTLNGPFRKDLLNARRMQILLGQSTQTAGEFDWFTQAGEDEYSSPAYRGLVCIRLNDMDLEPYYGRFPQFLVEVVQGAHQVATPTTIECHLAGLDDSQIDIVSEPQFGFGVAIDGPQPFKSLLELAPNVCVAEVDGTLKFMAVPGASEATVTDGELGAIQTGREDVEQQPIKFGLSREQSATVPQRVEVTYADPDNKYQQASVGYARQYGVARGVVHLQVAFAHTRASAISYASQFIARSWTERDTLKFNLLPKYIKYHPGDVLTITAPNSQLIDCRILTMDFKPGTHPVEITAVRQLRGTGAGNPSDMEPGTPDTSDEVTFLPSVSVLSNVPALIDDHDGFAGIYWAAGPLEASTTTPPAEWKGAMLIRNACGSDDANKVYEAVGQTKTAAVIGIALTELADGSGIDATNTVDIDFPFGDGTNTLIGIHDDAFTKTTTANLCILNKEVLQFRDIEDVSDDYSLPAGRVWRLSQLKRGQRNTEAYTGDHAVDDVFVLWNPDSVIRVPMNMDEQGDTWNFKTLTHGQEETEVDPTAFTVEDGGDTVIKDTEP